MAHISGPVVRHDVGHGEGTSTQKSTYDLAPVKCCIPLKGRIKGMHENVQNSLKGLPKLLSPHLPQIILLKPENGHLFSFNAKVGAYTIWFSHIRPKEEDCQIRAKSDIPVQNQGDHESCWSTVGSEYISEARHIHHIDEELTLYSGQYLTDFADRCRAMKSFLESDKEHYCYAYPGIKGLEYAMVHGMPKSTDWAHTGCGTGFPSKSDVKLHHVLNDVRAFPDVYKAIQYLKVQPILGNIGVFKPEFKSIGDKVYRGPTSARSVFSGWHGVLIRYITVENGETIAHCKNSHGEAMGVLGYFKASLDIMLLELDTTGKKTSYTLPSRIFRSFLYGEVRSEYEREVVEHYIEGQDIDQQLNSSDYMPFLILEGICHNTSGNVIQSEDGQNEFIGSPTNRALLKWAVKSGMNFTSIKSESIFMKRSLTYKPPECLGTAIECKNNIRLGVRVHWKGDATTILRRCTEYTCKDEFLPMSETKRDAFKMVIDNMVAKKLICIALAFTPVLKKNLPSPNERKQWKLPSENLVLLAIFGIKNPCGPVDNDDLQALKTFGEENEEEASRTNLIETTTSPSLLEAFKQFGVVEGTMDEEIWSEGEI